MFDASPHRGLRFLNVAFLALALGGGLASPVAAAERWVPLGPSGGQVRLLAQATSDPAHLYLATEPSGLFGSRDGGRSWQSIRRGFNGGGLQHLAVAPGDPDVVLAATYGDSPFYQVWHTEDGGATWAPAARPPGSDGTALMAQDLLIDPVDPRTAYAATERGIFRSLDGGSTWDSWALPDVQTSVIARDPAAPATWLAWGSDRRDFHTALFRSDDGGSAWTEIPISPSDSPERLFFRAGTLYAQRSGALYRSTDGALTWSLAARLPTLAAYDFAIAPSGTIYAAAEPGVYSSTDGVNWSPPETTFPDQASPKDGVFRLAVVSGGPLPGSETVIAGGRRGVWRSTDRGATWKPASRGIAVHSVESLIVIPNPEGTVLGSFDDGVYRIDRSGKSWQRLETPSGFEFPELAADPHHPGRVYALGAFGAFGVSEDRGNSWRQLSRLPNSGVILLKVDPVHPDILYAGIMTGGGSSSEYYGYRSVDGGAHWTEILYDVLFDVIFDPARPNVGYRLTFSGIDKTTDGGNRWRRLTNLPEQLLGSGADSILIDSRSHALYVGTEDRGVFRSTDSARTFRRINAGLPRLSGGHQPAIAGLIEDAAGDVYAALPYNGVFRLKPGEGWTAVNTGLPLETFVRMLVANPEFPGLLYAGSIGSSVHRLEND
ncbi:MAG TPA: hypothetical protein VN851_11080 [Thermoanaerobaculia bacterium]|nr:hypothetical protein [Thermoanaerobaculia bacterium]